MLPIAPGALLPIHFDGQPIAASVRQAFVELFDWSKRLLFPFDYDVVEVIALGNDRPVGESGWRETFLDAFGGDLSEKRKFQEGKTNELQAPQESARTGQQTDNPDDKRAAGSHGSGTLEVLSDTMGIDFGPYLSSVVAIVRQNWYELVPESARRKTGNVSIEFSIMKDGSISGLKRDKSSGDPTLDRAAWGGITASSPFPALPTEFKGKYLALRFTFSYIKPLSNKPLSNEPLSNEPPRNPIMAPLVADVRQKNLRENVRNDKNAKTDLEYDIAALTKLLDAGTLDATDDAGARFYRAVANSTLDFLRIQDGQPPNMPTAEHALSDLDRIIAGEADIRAWSITVPDTQYYAGWIAGHVLRSDSRAYSYWRRCADSAHSGCELNLAGAYTGGWGEVQPDPAKALDLYLKAFENNNVCVGASAATSIASLLYFTRTSYPQDNDPISWLRKSYAMSDMIESEPNNEDRCGGSGARIDEFLYRLARGDRQNDILAQAAQRLGADSTTRKALIDYLSGSLGVDSFQTTINSSKSDSGRCYAYFHALGYADLTSNTILVNKFYQPLLKFDHLTCGSYVLFARKFHPEGADVHPPAAQR